MVSGKRASFSRARRRLFGSGTLYKELTSVDLDTDLENKVDRLNNFFRVPKAMEKLLMLGTIICLNSLMEVFTLLPLRVAFSAIKIFCCLLRGRFRPSSAERLYFTQFLLLVLSLKVIGLLSVDDIYHKIRGQSLIKLYVIFNTLDVCGRLFYAFGEDITNALYSTILVRQEKLLPSCDEVVYFTISFTYVCLHTLLLYYQAMTLNVAFNSKSNALFTLLLSSQFSEVKSHVFKKYDHVSFYKIVCSDMRERIQLYSFVFIIIFREIFELVADNLSCNDQIPSISPFKDFILHPSLHLLRDWTKNLFLFMDQNFLYILSAIFVPSFVTIGSELFVDFVKHAFILRFNKISGDIYNIYTMNICKSIDTPQLKKEFKNENISAKAARIVEFVPIPLACLLLSVIIGTLKIVDEFGANPCKKILVSLTGYPIQDMILRHLITSKPAKFLFSRNFSICILCYIILLKVKLILNKKLLSISQEVLVKSNR